MAKIKGKWVFNETIDAAIFSEDELKGFYIVLPYFNYRVTSLSADENHGNGDGTGNVYGYLTFNGYDIETRTPSQLSEVYTTTDGWSDSRYRTIHLGVVEQEVSDKFYNWIVENATVDVSPIEIPITSLGKFTLATANKYCDRDIELDIFVDNESYDYFWDTYQLNGARTGYAYAFAGGGWNDNFLRPKYNLIIGGDAQGMFRQAKIVNLETCLGNRGIVFDTSKITGAAYMFYYCTSLTTLPKIDLSGFTSSSASTSKTTSIFDNCSKLHTIRELKVGIYTKFGETTFRGCSGLKNLTMTGTLAQNGLNLSACKQLTQESLLSVVNALQDKTSDTSQTWKVILGATNLSTLGADGQQLARDKNWLLSEK